MVPCQNKGSKCLLPKIPYPTRDLLRKPRTCPPPPVLIMDQAVPRLRRWPKIRVVPQSIGSSPRLVLSSAARSSSILPRAACTAASTPARRHKRWFLLQQVRALRRSPLGFFRWLHRSTHHRWKALPCPSWRVLHPLPTKRSQWTETIIARSIGDRFSVGCPLSPRPAPSCASSSDAAESPPKRRSLPITSER